MQHSKQCDIASASMIQQTYSMLFSNEEQYYSSYPFYYSANIHSQYPAQNTSMTRISTTSKLKSQEYVCVYVCL